jgi:hypothetical protein
MSKELAFDQTRAGRHNKDKQHVWGFFSGYPAEQLAWNSCDRLSMTEPWKPSRVVSVREFVEVAPDCLPSFVRVA